MELPYLLAGDTLSDWGPAIGMQYVHGLISVVELWSHGVPRNECGRDDFLEQHRLSVVGRHDGQIRVTQGNG